MNEKSAEEVMEELSRVNRISDSRDYRNGFLAGLAHGREEAKGLVGSLNFDYDYYEAKPHKCLDLLNELKKALESYKRKVGEK